MYLIYSALLAVFLTLSLPYWLIQMLRHGKYREGLRQRLGGVPPHLLAHKPSPTVWIHAVSVGEVLAVSGIVQQLQRRLPDHRILVSTTTATGQRLARTRFGTDNVFYFPLDFAFTIQPYLKTLRPELVVLAETEFWPNFLRLSKSQGASVAVINARISDRSLPGYRRVRRWLTRVLENIDLLLAQTDEDCRRLIDIGANADRVLVSGNLKFDVAPPPTPAVVESLRQNFRESGARPILVCGSTLETEEALLLSAFRNVLASHPKAVMVLAPRHPERFPEVAALLESVGMRFWRRSLWSGEPIVGGVLLVDTIGELSSLYQLGTLAFVGGSLVQRGGHNIIEPALYGVPVIIGNHYENFRDIVGLFQRHNAVRVVGPAELPLVFMELISDEPERAAMGRRGTEALESQRGATERTVEALLGLRQKLERTEPALEMTRNA
jgi:3-deoxy-D-manno-octulosonic-acid transferase